MTRLERSAAGHRVNVWNRTASRADRVVAAGATLASSPRDAVAAAPLVLISLTDYAAMYDVLTSDAQQELAPGSTARSPSPSRPTTTAPEPPDTVASTGRACSRS